MKKKRDDFLTAFFVSLFIVFSIAVYLRIRSYRVRDAATEKTTTTATVQSTPAPRQQITQAPPEIIEESPARGGASSPARSSPLVASPTATSPAELSPPRRPPQSRQTAAPKPSLLQRVIAPVVNVVTGGSQTPVARAVTAEQRPSQTSSSSRPHEQVESSTSSSSSGSKPSSSQPGSDPNPREQQDATSDSRPPQLFAIEFSPPQVQDGEETTLIVTANDDNTGVQSISGTIIAPSGAVQGYACQREGDTNRFVSRITVPRDAAEGMWRVNYINLVDRASNAVAFTAQMGTIPPTAAFRVTSSRPDSEGPTLRAIWIDRRAMRGGEKNTVFVDAIDERSGVNLVTGVFQSPSKFARVGFICKSGTTWTCELTAPACADCGDWTLEQIQLQDKANNMTSVRGDNQLVAAIHVDITSDSCDATPPALESMTLNTNVVSNASDTNITVTATLSDDACGVLSVSGQAVGPATSGQPPRRYFSLTASGDPRTWTGTLTIPQKAAKGVWRISFVQVLDRGHNLKTYGQGDPVLANTVFTVQ